MHAFCHALPETWQAMGVMLSAAGSLQWLHDTLAGDVPFDALVAEAEAWAPGAEGLLFLPYLAGERTPHADPDARGAFVGLELRHDRGALVRAVLEGVAFGLRDSLDLLRALGVEAATARVSGGGARSRLWLRIVASVLGVPLELTESEEGSAFGAALLGGVAGGVFADVDAAVARCVRVDGHGRARRRVAGGLRRGARALPGAVPGARPVSALAPLGRVALSRSAIQRGRPRRLTIQSYDISIGRHRRRRPSRRLARDKEVRRCE